MFELDIPIRERIESKLRVRDEFPTFHHDTFHDGENAESYTWTLELVSPLGGGIQICWEVSRDGEPLKTRNTLPFEVAYREWDRTHGQKAEWIEANCATPEIAGVIAVEMYDRHMKEVGRQSLQEWPPYETGE